VNIEVNFIKQETRNKKQETRIMIYEVGSGKLEVRYTKWEVNNSE